MSLSPSLGNLNALMASFNATAGNAVFTFLDGDSTSNWESMHDAINGWKTANTLSALDLRSVITLSDGTVAYDSSKSNNSHANYTAKNINENHNSRVAILQALLGNSGVGFETKYSTSTNKMSYYLAQRVGNSNSDTMGVIRISVSQFDQ
jgi:hypothetical protein